MSVRIIRLRDVMAITGLSRSTLYQYIKSGIFPAQIKLGMRCVGWIEQDVQQWIQDKMS